MYVESINWASVGYDVSKASYLSANWWTTQRCSIHKPVVDMYYVPGLVLVVVTDPRWSKIWVHGKVNGTIADPREGSQGKNKKLSNQTANDLNSIYTSMRNT